LQRYAARRIRLPDGAAAKWRGGIPRDDLRR
jgi:hypothetical protein